GANVRHLRLHQLFDLLLFLPVRINAVAPRMDNVGSLLDYKLPLDIVYGLPANRTTLVEQGLAALGASAVLSIRRVFAQSLEVHCPFDRLIVECRDTICTGVIRGGQSAVVRTVNAAHRNDSV